VGQVPVIVFIGPAIGIGLMIFFLIFRRTMMSWSDKRYSAYRVGALAQRMRLWVAEGDPKANFIQGTKHYSAKSKQVGGLVRQVFGDEADETRILLRGSPYGRPTEFIYYYRTEVSDRIAVRFLASAFDCRLRLHLPVAPPPFELVLRGTPFGVKAKPEWGLPRQSLGDRELDARFTLTCNDPRLGAVLAPVIRGLAGGHEYLHVQARGQILQAIIPEDAVMYAVVALERTQSLLEYMANALVGPVVASAPPRG